MARRRLLIALALLLVFGSCIGLAFWAGLAQLRQGARDRLTLQGAYRQLADEAAQSASEAMRLTVQGLLTEVAICAPGSEEERQAIAVARREAPLVGIERWTGIPGPGLPPVAGERAARLAAEAATRSVWVASPLDDRAACVVAQEGRVAIGLVRGSDWTVRATRALEQRTTLSRLASAHLERFGSVPTAASVAVVAPWGEVLLVPQPAWPRPPGRSLSPDRLGWSFLAAALISLAAGLGLLALLVRRSLSLARLKEDFASTVSHELRTPAAVIRLHAELLAGGYARDEAARQRSLAALVEESGRIAGLVDNLLEFSRIERGGRRYERLPLDLATVARRVLDAYAPLLERDGFAVQAALAPAPVLGDESALAGALINLLANAQKFSETDRRVAVRCGTQAGQAYLAVEDHGIGVGAADRARLFQPFVRLDRNRARGTGLGLVLVRHVAEGHGGRVELESEPGQGSVFTLVLPLASGAGS